MSSTGIEDSYSEVQLFWDLQFDGLIDIVFHSFSVIHFTYPYVSRCKYSHDSVLKFQK